MNPWLKWAAAIWCCGMAPQVSANCALALRLKSPNPATVLGFPQPLTRPSVRIEAAAFRSQVGNDPRHQAIIDAAEDALERAIHIIDTIITSVDDQNRLSFARQIQLDDVNVMAATKDYRPSFKSMTELGGNDLTFAIRHRLGQWQAHQMRPIAVLISAVIEAGIGSSHFEASLRKVYENDFISQDLALVLERIEGRRADAADWLPIRHLASMTAELSAINAQNHIQALAETPDIFLHPSFHAILSDNPAFADLVLNVLVTRRDNLVQRLARRYFETARPLP